MTTTEHTTVEHYLVEATRRELYAQAADAPGRIGTGAARQAQKDELRAALAASPVVPTVRALRAYFNHLRLEGEVITGFEVWAALRTLRQDEARQANQDRLFRERMARQSERASHIQHGDPRCLTEETDGECVCA